MSLGLALVAIGCQLMTHVGAPRPGWCSCPGSWCAAWASDHQPGGWPRVGLGRAPERSACRPGRRAPSARSGSPPASRPRRHLRHQIKPAVVTNLKGSSAGTAVLVHGGQGLGTALASGGVRQAAAGIPRRPDARPCSPPTRTASHDVQPPHVDAAVIALIGAIGCLFLVRQKDFVPSVGSASGPPRPVRGEPVPDGQGPPVAAPGPAPTTVRTRPAPPTSAPVDPVRR